MVVTMNRKLIVTHTSPPDRRGRRNHMRMELDLDAPVNSPKQWMDVTQVMTKMELINRRAEACAMFLMGDAGSIYETYMRADKADAVRRARWDSQRFYFQQAGRAIRDPAAYRKVMDDAAPRYPQMYGRATRPTGMVPEITAPYGGYDNGAGPSLT